MRQLVFNDDEWQKLVVDGSVVRITDAATASSRIYTQVYDVADLVLPVPEFVRPAKLGSDRPRADFRGLIELISTAVYPESWERAGGAGVIREFPANLSLAVSQSRDVHEQIAELLETIRRLKGLPVRLAMHVMHVSSSDAFGNLNPTLVEKLDRLPTVLDGEESKAVLERVQADRRSNIFNTAVVSNGQRAILPLAPYAPNGTDSRRELVLLPQRSPDGEVVRMSVNIAGGAKSRIAQANHHFITSGHALLIEIPAETNEVPLLTKIPHLDRLFRQNTSHERTLVLITKHRGG